MKVFSVLSLGAVGAYNAGGCNDDVYVASNSMPCKTTCDGITKVGRNKAAKYSAQMISENTLLSKFQVPVGAKSYIGLLRFDSKFCTNAVLTDIENQVLRVDVGDKANAAYTLEAVTWSDVPADGNEAREAAMVQFRRTAGHSDQVSKTRDVVYAQMSGFYGSTSYNQNDVIECFNSMYVSYMNDDGGNDNSADYTKCALYDRYGSTPDWTEIAGTTTTTAPTTTTDDGDNLIPTNARCQSSTISKIVGGDEVVAHSWPWAVGVRMGGYMCGGSILNNNHVMTAAHCCEGFSASSIYVIAGDHNNQISDGEKQYDAKKVIMHPKYGENDGYNYNYDFCILEVDDLELDKNTKDIVCIPKQGEHVNPTSGLRADVKGDRCYVAGWGTTSSGGSLSADLLSVKVDIFSHDFCNQQSQYSNNFDQASEFCAGKMAGGIDSCQGDSGGPLVCIDGHNQPILYGVVSWGYGCAFNGYPGIYAKVAAVVDWIESTVGVTSEPDEDEDNVVWQTGGAHLPNNLDSCSSRNPVHTSATPAPKIFGGTVVGDNHQWKWMARLTVDGVHACGGSILSNEYILTAGSCCQGMSADMFQVVVGDYTSAGNDVGEFTVSPVDMTIHPNYDEGWRNGVKAISNDVCLLKVPDLAKQAPASCNECWDTVCLPSSHADYGSYCWVAGWGKTKSDGNKSNKLRDVGVNVMGPKFCDEKTGYSGQVNKAVEFCAGQPDKNHDGTSDAGGDRCDKDEGGPLVCVEDNQPILYGVVSWGNKCGEAGSPGVYAKVSALKSWIASVMNP